MQPVRRLIVGSLLAAAAVPGLAQTAWPSRPIRLILPFGPGSASDVLARTYAEPLSRALKQPIVIEHRPGANSTIGSNMVAKAAPDGYTFGMLTNAGLAASPGGLTDNVPYDTAKDFAYVTMVASLDYVLLVHPSLNAKTVREVVDYVKANPGKLSYGSGNTGGITYGGWFRKTNGLDIAHIQYKSTPPAMVDLVAGHVHMMVADAGSALPMVQAGKIRAIAVPTPKRHPLMPEVPTFAESGFPTPPDFSGWWALTAPAATPNDILERMNTELVPILNRPEIRASLLRAGIVALSSTRDEAARYQREQLQVWTKMIAETGLKAE